MEFHVKYILLNYFPHPQPWQLWHGICQHGLHLHGQNGMQTHGGGVVFVETVVVVGTVVDVVVVTSKIKFYFLPLF